MDAEQRSQRRENWCRRRADDQQRSATEHYSHESCNSDRWVFTDVTSTSCADSGTIIYDCTVALSYYLEGLSVADLHGLNVDLEFAFGRDE